MQKLIKFLRQSTGTTVVSELIDGLSIPNSTMSRYLNGERKMPVGVLVDLAEKYGFSLLDAMVAADFITEEHAEREKRRYGLTTTSDQDLTREVLRRLEAVSGSLLDDETQSEYAIAAFEGEDDMGVDYYEG